MPSAATRSSSMGSSDIEFALDLKDIAAHAAKVDCIGALACGCASFSYHRLPEPPLGLTVRKLDDSYFDVRIARSAAVWELKAAIQGVFVALYHFCLCFKDEKMTDDKATFRAFGIKDGDEVCALSSSVIGRDVQFSVD
ncbi:hypothetical protein D1007_43219 [Hordeum vulgare]|nr:hypothetical protein D1007_43219 [Hordeum vulgare]